MRNRDNKDNCIYPLHINIELFVAFVRPSLLSIVYCDEKD